MINNQKGLSLIGVIISIFIVSTSLVAILSLANMSLKGSAVGETRLIASGLAQEGVEIVRHIRRGNSDWIDWDWYGNNGAIATSTSQDYKIQYNNSNLISFSDIPLKIDSNGFYQYDSGDNTFFYRKINLTKVSFQEVKVAVEVKWNYKGDWHYLNIEDHLWNWK